MRGIDPPDDDDRERSPRLPRSVVDRPSPGRWTKAPPTLSRRQRTATTLTLLALGATVIVTFRWISFAALFVVAQGASFRLLNGRWSLIPTKSDRRLLEDPDDPDVCLVQVEVFRNEKSVGSDRGVAWFVDGLLLYSGHRTSFAVGGQDVLVAATNTLEESDVPLKVEAGTATLRIVPLVVNGGGAAQDMRFLKRLYEFRRRPSISNEPRQWPPLEPWRGVQ